jgi:hypothetical protein
MRLSITCLLISLAAGCGIGVESSPETPRTDPPAGGCEDPEGPLHPYTTAAEVETLILGQWRHCSGPTLKPDQAGVEFAADHKIFALVDDIDGGLVRKTGFDSEGTWRADPVGAHVQLSYYTPTGGNGGQPEFEDTPSRFSIRLTTGNASAIYVKTGP